MVYAFRWKHIIDYHLVAFETVFDDWVTTRFIGDFLSGVYALFEPSD